MKQLYNIVDTTQPHISQASASLVQMAPRAGSSFLAGLAALRSGDFRQAEIALERAHRWDELNAHIIFFLGVALLRNKSQCSVEMFRSITSKYDMVEGWNGLAQAELLSQNHDGSKAALATLLNRHAISDKTDIALLKSLVYKSAGDIAWCGFTSSGGIRVYLSSADISENLEVFQNGEVVATKPNLVSSKFVELALCVPVSPEGNLYVYLGGNLVFGSPLALSYLTFLEGFIEEDNGNLVGWAWHPFNAEAAPCLSVVSNKSGAGIKIIATSFLEKAFHPRPFATPREIFVPQNQLEEVQGLLQIVGADGRNLYGSPIDPKRAQRNATAAAAVTASLFPVPGRSEGQFSLDLACAEGLTDLCVPAHLVGKAAHGSGRPRRVDVVIPVYGAGDVVLPCLKSVLDTLPTWAQVIVVDDGSTDFDLKAVLFNLSLTGAIKLISNSANLGFPAAVNVGIAVSSDNDIVILNSDTLLPVRWLQRLRSIVYSAQDIGTATPMSNDASILSYPSPLIKNPQPSLQQMQKIDALAERANRNSALDIPTGVGFCMYVRRQCFDEVGRFREDVFAQGYGEENDFCIRARHLGWRHVAATGVFVAHVGGKSFGSAKPFLMARNLKTLNALHPGYDSLVSNPDYDNMLRLARRQLEIELWIESRTSVESVLIFTHNRGGGVEKRVNDLRAEIMASGYRAIVLSPINIPSGFGCLILDTSIGDTPNLIFSVPGEINEIATLLASDRVLRAEVHHLVGHDHKILKLCELLDIPYDMIIHDYASFCPRLSLVTGTRHYCGEPEVPCCIDCIADNGALSGEDITVPDLIIRSQKEFLNAKKVIAPSTDVATRMKRHFSDLVLEVEPWEKRDYLLNSLVTAPLRFDKKTRRVAIIGAIGVEKGFDIVLALGRDAAIRALSISYVLVGYSADDDKLLETGYIQVTGPYIESEAAGLVFTQKADFCFLPSICPETWSYSISMAWGCNLDVAAFDFGTQALRIRESGRGWLLPLGLQPAKINDFFLSLGDSIGCTDSDR